MASRIVRDFANGLADLLFGQRIERRGRFVEHQQFGRRSSARAIDSRCFSPPETFTPPSPISVSKPAIGARLKQAIYGSLPQHLQTFFVGRIRAARTANSRESIRRTTAHPA